MSTVQIRGFLTEDGKIQLDLPNGWQPGEITVNINVEPTFTDEEIDALMSEQVKPANQIITGGWEHLNITDSVEWVREQRQKRRGDTKW
ncbi:MAG: hypothetical protein AAFV93_23110 [Chloroflexota bacterium]